MYTNARESLGFVHRSRAIFCRLMPNLGITIRIFLHRFMTAHAPRSQVRTGLLAYGLKDHGLITSPIKGAAAGNTEFLMHFTRESMELPAEPLAVEEDEEEVGGAEDERAPEGETEGESGRVAPLDSAYEEREVKSAIPGSLA
jgi:hypothetical protein